MRTRSARPRPAIPSTECQKTPIRGTPSAQRSSTEHERGTWEGEHAFHFTKYSMAGASLSPMTTRMPATSSTSPTSPGAGSACSRAAALPFSKTYAVRGRTPVSPECMHSQTRGAWLERSAGKGSCAQHGTRALAPTLYRCKAEPCHMCIERTCKTGIDQCTNSPNIVRSPLAGHCGLSHN